VPGLGPARRAALLKAFGSVKALSAGLAEEMAAVAGVGPKLAETVVAALHSVSRDSSVSGGGGVSRGGTVSRGSDVNTDSGTSRGQGTGRGESKQ